VSRILRLVVHNWPLKVAAIGLATLLYGGLVLSRSDTTFTGGVIPVTVLEQPDDAFLLTQPPPVTEVRYVAGPDVPTPISASFIATIDLAGVTPGGGPQSVPIRVEAIDPRITVAGSEPSAVLVALDTLTEATVPVVIERGQVPVGLEVGETTVDPDTVTISGPASIVDSVVAARGDVVIQASGLDVDQDVRLIAVDQLGAAITPIQLAPATVRVTIPVFSDRQSRTLPVSPLISGDPAAGFEIASVTVDPPAVTVEGDIDELEAMASVETAAVSVAGLSGPRVFTTTLVLPTGVVALGPPTVDVSVTVRPVTSTRTFEVGLRLVGTDPALAYRLGTDRVLLTLGGSTADLDRIDGATLVASLEVGDLPVGTHIVTVTATLPGGVALVGADPSVVTVSVTSLATPSPSPSAEGLAPTPPPSPAPGSPEPSG
jgi:YbbR domain-containing protein